MNHPKLPLALFFCITLTVPVMHSGAQPAMIKESQWLQNWFLCGPFKLGESTDETRHLPGFETDFLETTGGETAPDVKAGKKVKHKSGKSEWFLYESPDSIVSLDKTISKESFVAAYAFTEVNTDSDGLMVLSLGSNDGVSVRVNGDLVFDCPEARGHQPGDDLIPVFLRKGVNTFLLKVEERGNQWEFSARLLPLDPEEFLHKDEVFRVEVSQNGVASVRFLPHQNIADELFSDVLLSVSDPDTGTGKWKGKWNRASEQWLPLDQLGFGRYSLTIQAKMKNGHSWAKEIPFVSGKRTDFILFENGKTTYSIVVNKEASDSELWAAKELQRWLNEISGAEFPLKDTGSETDDHQIIVGYSDYMSSIPGVNVEKPADTDETCHYTNQGGRIFLWGGRERGTMYSVFSFLENELGCRWYTPSVNVIPKRGKYVFQHLNHQESPSVRVRNDFYFEAFDPVWAARNKINGAMNTRIQPGGVEGYWSVHTFYPLMPPEEFFDTHPEYYSLIDGKRTHDRAQLCLTNPDVLDIITQRLKEVMRINPDNLIYSVSQNDWRNPCQCDHCQAIAKKEGSESGPVVWFVNQVADRIRDEYPGKFVGTLAYQYTRKPPAHLVPRDNVVIRLCSIECCFAHSFTECQENSGFFADLEGWSAIAPQVYIWDYVVNFSHYIMPYPNFHVLKQNIKTLRDNKAIGIMEQGAYQSRGAEFAELRAYLLAKLLWNTEIDVDGVINDFLNGYYGRSGQHIRAYFDYLHSRVTPDTHIHLGLRPDDQIFSGEFISRAEAFFNKAELVADTEEIRKRVEVARLPVMYLKCRTNPVEALYDGTYDRLKAILAREGITHLAEAGKTHADSFHRFMESFRQEKN